MRYISPKRTSAHCKNPAPRGSACLGTPHRPCLFTGSLTTKLSEERLRDSIDRTVLGKNRTATRKHQNSTFILETITVRSCCVFHFRSVYEPSAPLGVAGGQIIFLLLSFCLHEVRLQQGRQGLRLISGKRIKQGKNIDTGLTSLTTTRQHKRCIQCELEGREMSSASKAS